MNEEKIGNPAVVGLGGFGMTTLILQFYNLGWVGVCPIPHKKIYLDKHLLI